jgi:hypothetical protein
MGGKLLIFTDAVITKAPLFQFLNPLLERSSVAMQVSAGMLQEDLNKLITNHLSSQSISREFLNQLIQIKLSSIIKTMALALDVAL